MSDHSKALWRESSGSGVVLDAAPMYLRRSGADVVLSATWPAELELIDLAADGNYRLIDRDAPWYLAASGSDFVLDAVGPAAAILVDDGIGGLTLSTDLSQTPAADFYADTAGDVHLVRRNADRLEAVRVGDNIHFY